LLAFQWADRRPKISPGRFEDHLRSSTQNANHMKKASECRIQIVEDRVHGSWIDQGALPQSTNGNHDSTSNSEPCVGCDQVPNVRIRLSINERGNKQR
jgi:hypothetical protein